MKSLIVVALFFLSLSLNAQVFPYLQNLEGSWLPIGRRVMGYSQWRLTDDCTLTNRTVSLRAGDTLVASTATIQIGATTASLSLQTDSLNHSQPQIFRLTSASDYDLYWQNENPTGLPQQLRWSFTTNNRLVFQADDLTTTYRFKRERKAKLLLTAHAGLNLSTLIRLNRNPLDSSTYAYGTRAGQEFGLALGLSSADRRLVCNLEVGVTHWRADVVADIRPWQGGRYGRRGTYDRTNLYLALVPEISFGKQQALSVAPGFFIGVGKRRGFEGQATSPGAGFPETRYDDPRRDIPGESGLLLGGAYRLPQRWFPLQPSFYARGMFGFFGEARVRAISAGLRFRL